MNNTTTITYDELAAINDRSYHAGFAMGVEIGRQNERFAQIREANKRVLAVCDAATIEPELSKK